MATEIKPVLQPYRLTQAGPQLYIAEAPDDASREATGLFGGFAPTLVTPDSTPASIRIEFDPDEDLTDAAPRDLEVVSAPTLKDLEPAAVLFVLRDVFSGEPWWEWELEALVDSLTFEEALDIFDATVDVDTVAALQLLLRDDSFWTEWEVFNWVTQGVNGLTADFSALPLLPPPYVLKGMDTALIITHVQGTAAEYSVEVKSYIAATFMSQGLWALPWPASVAQKRLDALMKLAGHATLPVKRVLALAQGNAALNEDEVGIQAARVRTLREIRAAWVGKASREIRAYRRHKTA